MNKKYNISDTISKKDYIELSKAIFTYLECIKPDWSEDMVFIDGEFDSNQTKFERKSNMCEIGVLSNSNDVGHCLLFFLRMIIDEYPSMFFSSFEFISTDEAEYDRTDYNLTMAEIFDVLKLQECIYTEVYKKDTDKQTIKKIEYNNKGPKTIIKNISCADINLWSLPQIRNSFLELLRNME